MSTRLLAAALIAACTLSACSDPAPRPTKVGVAFDHPGLSDQVLYERVGLDTQVARTLADGLGIRGRVDLGFQQTTGRDRAASVMSGASRFALGSEPLPADFRGRITEIGPYLVSGLALAGKSTPDPTRLAGRPVCVVAGSDAEDRLATIAPGAVARPVQVISTCLSRVAEGQADAALDDNVVLRAYAATGAYGRLEVTGPLAPREHMVWVQAKNDKLCRSLTASLRQMVASGRWAKAVEGDLVTTGVLDRVPAVPTVRGC